MYRLSITHNFCLDLCPKNDICEAVKATSNDDVAWWQVSFASEIAAELG